MATFIYIDTILFALSAFTVIYMLFFAIAAMVKRSDQYLDSKIKHRFSVIFPAYQDDEYILLSVKSFLQQDYPIDCYDIVVIADHLQPETNIQLSQLPIILLQGNLLHSSKMKSVKVAMNQLQEGDYDLVLIMNADNIADTNLLNELNNTYSSGSNAIQVHRIRQERPNSIAVLNAVTDEINNSIFRVGHSSLGLSSSLNGSGMAFDFAWFKQIIANMDNKEDEKAIESLLLKEHIFIEYLNKSYIYATRKEGKKKFYTQRQNWIKAHYYSLFTNIGNLPGAILSGNFDYADRILQWLTFPRTILLSLILFAGVFNIYFDWINSLKWWGLLFIFLLTLAFATPNYLVDNKFNKAMKMIPVMGIGMFLNLFKRTRQKQ